MSNIEHSAKESTTQSTKQTIKDNIKNNSKKRNLTKAQRKRKLLIKSAVALISVIVVIIGVILYMDYRNNQKRFCMNLKEGIDRVAGQTLDGQNIRAIELQLGKLDFFCMISDEQRIQNILDDIKALRVAKMKVSNKQEETGSINGDGTQIYIYTNTEKIIITTRYEIGKVKNGLSVGIDDKNAYYEPLDDLEEIIEKHMLEYEPNMQELTVEEVQKLAQKDKITWSDFESYEGVLSVSEYLSNMDKQWWIRAYNDTTGANYCPDEEPEHIEIYSKKGGSMDIRDAGLEIFIKEKIEE